MMATAAALLRRSVVVSRSSSPFSRYLHMLYFSSNVIAPTLQFTQDYYVSKYHFSPQIASKLASVSARLRNPQNADLFLSYLQQTGFSNAHLETIVTHHTQLLSSCPEKNVKPKFKIFHDLGFSAPEAADIIARNPNILHYQPKRIIHSFDVYRRLLGSNHNVIELIKKYSSLLYADPETTILPNIQFLKECGVQTDQINSCICTIPFFFVRTPQNMRRCAQVDEMGVERTSRTFIYAAWAVSNMSDVSLKFKLKCLQDLGFSEEDISRVFRSAPMVIAASTRKIKEVKDVLLETGKYDMLCIIKNPSSLTCSVEKRYKPRLRVLKELERKGLINKWPVLSKLFTMTDKRFFEEFVAPNINEVGEEFISMTAADGNIETATGLKPS